jgi:hypothetical protein
MKRTIASRSIGRGLAKVEVVSSDTLIAFAAKAGSTAADGDGSNSPFTTALLKHIATPGLDLRLSLGRVRDEVLKATKGKQEPFVYGSLGGSNVALVPAATKTVVAMPAPTVPVASSVAPAATDPQAAMRRDYAFAERIGTREAWDQFLLAYPTGFYAGLARAARHKLEAEAKSRTATTKPSGPVLAAAPSGAAAGPQKSATDPVQTAKLLQTELRRIGCYPGAASGEWNDESRRALDLFNKHAGTRLDVKLASLDTLNVVRGKTTRICPLECQRGFKPQGDVCVKIACPKAQYLGDDGICRSRKEGARSASSREPSQTRSAPQGEGAIVCSRQGCVAVKPGCRTVTTGAYDRGGLAVVCN